MSADMIHFVSGHSGAKHRLRIVDLPTDVLVLIFSLLRGQDIARSTRVSVHVRSMELLLTCYQVCRSFSDLSHLCLQYTIDLAQNGMVDGNTSVLPVSERLQRLRQYSSDFRIGTFYRECSMVHTSFLLIPCAALRAQAHAALSGQGATASTDSGEPPKTMPELPVRLLP